jgi:hypothetical protein
MLSILAPVILGCAAKASGAQACLSNETVDCGRHTQRAYLHIGRVVLPTCWQRGTMGWILIADPDTDLWVRWNGYEFNLPPEVSAL